MAGLALLGALAGASMTPPRAGQQPGLEQTGGAGGARRERKEGGKAVLSMLLGPDLAISSSLPTYLLFAVSDFLSFVAIYIPYTHLPPLAKVAAGDLQ